MSKYIEYKIQDTRTGQVFTTLAKDRIDAKEQVADLYEIDYDFLEVI